MLPRQFDGSLPQRLRQLRPPRLSAAKLIQLALQLVDWLGNSCAFAVHIQPPPGRLNEANRLGHPAALTLAGNSRNIIASIHCPRPPQPSEILTRPPLERLHPHRSLPPAAP